MKIVADESVDFAIVKSLREADFVVYSILEEHSGWPDEEVLALSFRLEALLITEDKDFGELTYRLKKPSHGILLVRMPSDAGEIKATLVVELLQTNPERLWKKFSVLESHKLRVKTMNL